MANSGSTNSRSLVFADGSSNKFWKIELDGSSHTVTFGRVGTNGQTQTKDFGSDDEAKKSYDKLVAEKIKKGYVDEAGGGASTAAASTTTATAKPAKAASTKTAAKSKAKASQADNDDEGDDGEDEGDGEAADAAVSTPPPAAGKKGKAKSAAKDEDQPAPAAAAAQPAPVAIDTSIERSIALAPVDWYRAVFKKLPPLVKGEPRPFDKDACLKALAKLKTNSYGWNTEWFGLNLPPDLSREESYFWLDAMTTKRGRDVKMKDFADEIAKHTLPTKITFDDVVELIKRVERGLDDAATQHIANLVSPTEYVSLIRGKLNSNDDVEDYEVTGLMHTLLDGFREHVVPHLSDAEREAIRKELRKRWDPTASPTHYSESFPPDYYLAAAVGMPDEIYQVTSTWADGKYGDQYAGFYQRPHHLVLGLGSPEMVVAEWKRVKVPMPGPDDARAFLACTEYSALDSITQRILAETNKDQCASFMEVLALVKAPEAAEPMLRCKLESKTPALARDWLEQNVGHAVRGLMDVAVGKGKLADAALDYLRGVKRNGHLDVLNDAVKAAGNSPAATKLKADVIEHEEKVFVPFDDKTTPDWLAKELSAAAKGKAKAVPSWATPAMLPPLVVGDKKLNDTQTATVIQALVATPITEKLPLFTQLREHVARSVRDEFAWRLFQSWQEDGNPPKEKWAMGTIAHLGDDGCVAKLTPLIRNWPGESQHARAVFGLECFRAIGSSVALMSLSGIAQKLKFKGLKAKAEQFVDEIAKERGLTRDELQDRVVPDCGLDEQGKRTFSFGPRSFTFVLGNDLKAMVREESGKVRGDLPGINAKDDQALATEAVADWKILKKQIKDVATIQAGRLEQAMITGRRWKVDDFESLLVRHPLMTHLAQKLIWAGFDAKGKRVTTFRITEERDFANPDDDGVSLAGAQTVGVVHPLELSEAEREQWGQVLGDYEIVAPFAQLGRELHSLETSERDDDDLKRYHGIKLPAPTLVFGLEKFGWLRGAALDGGCFDEHSKQFPAANVTAVVVYEGTVGMGYIEADSILTIEHLKFYTGMREPSGYNWSRKDEPIKLRDVPPIVLSEVMADMQVLKSKAK